MTYIDRLCRDLFGDGMHINERRPERLTSTDKVLAVCGTVFLIAVATYLPLKITQDRAYLENRRTFIFERCVQETGRFEWCYQRYTL